MTSTGVGSMPGTDPDEAVRTAVGACPDLPFLPELPGRGAPAAMIGRTAGLLVEMPVDLQPAGWRLTDAPGRDLVRSRSFLARDLDALEEHTQGYAGALKVQVVGPWTLAAEVERPRGDKVLADHGARRDLAESLAAGIGEHVALVRRRVPDARLVVQVDEPSLPAVLRGGIRTASGFGRHRTVTPPEADRALRGVVDAVVGAGARPVVHLCAPDVPVDLLAGAGFAALSFDLGLVGARTTDSSTDAWARAYEGGLDLWPGVVPPTEPATRVVDTALRARVERFFATLGFAPEAYASRLVVTPTCGLAGATPAWSRRALRLAALAGAVD